MQIAAGAAHSVAVSWEGEAFTWGWGFIGTLGHGNELNCLIPTRVSLSAYAGLRDGAAGTLHNAHSSLGAADSRRGVAGCVHIERVTCAAAIKYQTVLGTSHGRVLNSTHMGRPDISHYAGFLELGRLPEGLRCWRVETALYLSYWPTLTVYAIDSAGHAHTFTQGTNLRASFVSTQAENTRTQADDVCTQADEGCKSCRDVVSMGSREKDGEIIDVGQGCGKEEGLHSVLAAPLRSPVSLTKCHSVFVSPSQVILDDTHVSFVPNGVQGWGSARAVVVVSDDGSLMTAAAKESGVHELRRLRSDNVLCAAVGVNETEPYGLIMVDGGASLLTWGDAITGQVRRRRCCGASSRAYSTSFLVRL